MADWLTIQWPARRSASNQSPSDFEDEPHGVWLQEEHREVFRLLKQGDRVFVYETKGGPSLEQHGTSYRCIEGRSGIVAIGTIRKFRRNGERQHYSTGARVERTWAFGGDFGSSVDRQGFVPRGRLNQVLGYSPRYYYRGYGLQRSGTGPLDKSTADAIMNVFRQRRPVSLNL